VEFTLTNGASVSNMSDPSGVVGQVAGTHPNGRIFWASNRTAPANFEVYSMFGDGTRFLNVSNDAAAFDAQPVTTTDGSVVAWAKGNHLWAANADGSVPIDLTVVGREPTWSPDIGIRIAYISDQAPDPGLRLLSSAGDVLLLPLSPATVNDIA
jgi:WD40-like Beta Propeller Repeat